MYCCFAIQNLLHCGRESKSLGSHLVVKASSQVSYNVAWNSCVLFEVKGLHIEIIISPQLSVCILQHLKNINWNLPCFIFIVYNILFKILYYRVSLPPCGCSWVCVCVCRHTYIFKALISTSSKDDVLFFFILFKNFKFVSANLYDI